MSLKFLSRFDCQDRADWLTPKRQAAFLAGIRYCGSTTPEKMHARVDAAPRGATGDAGVAATHMTRARPPHAVRVLARAWVHVLWRCWQDGVAYDPAHHAGLQRFAQARDSSAELDDATLAVSS